MSHYISIEQSKGLLELGLNRETADCFYTEFGTVLLSKPCEDGLEPAVPYTPCWTVGALLRLLPKFTLQTIGIMYLLVDEKHDHCVDGISIVDVCYKMIVWLLQNGLMKED